MYFGSYTKWASRGQLRMLTHKERLAADAVAWQGDLDALLLSGARCTCVPGTHRCELHEMIDFTVDLIREGSGAAL